jgi:hypothetical protein
MIERASRIATVASTLAITALLLWLHPDITTALQVAGAAAFLLAWLAAGWRADGVLSACLVAAPVAPALLRLATGRDQPVLDIVWMAAMSGGLLRGASWSRWALLPSWRPLAGGWALALALAWPVLLAREAGFEPEGLRDAGAVVSWASWPAPFAASWTLYWVLTQLLGLLWLDWLSGRFLELGRLPGAGHALWIGTTLASTVAVFQGTIDLTFLNPPFWSALGRATGTMLEANGYGHAAAMAGPVAFVVLRSARPHAPAWAWAALAVNWLGLWMSGSRLAALFCGATGAAGLAVALWRSSEPGARGRTIGSAALLATAAMALVLGGVATGPLRRLAEIPLSRASVADFWDRGGYGSIAMQIVREYPLTGTGAGTFHYLAPDYWRETADDALAPDNAQNWWRHQAAELGIFGGSLVLIWSALVAWHVLVGRAVPVRLQRGSHPPGEESARTMAAPVVRGLLVGIGLSSLLGVPTQNPIVLLWFFLLASWLCVLVQEPGPAAAAGFRVMRGTWAVAALLAMAYGGETLRLARTSLSVVERARRFEREYVAGAYQPERLPGGDAFRWTDDESRFVLPAATPWLVVRVWAAHPDIQAEPVEVTLSTPCGVLWDGVLRTEDPVTVGIVLPDGLRVVDTTVDVARTWHPSAYGSSDSRALGVGISTAFAGSREGVEEQTYTVRWPACPGRSE